MLPRTAFLVGALLFLAPALALGTPAPTAPRTVVCTGAIEHPVSVRVEALDPIHRGASVRFRVRSTSITGLARAEARVLSSGDASLVGPRRVALGNLRAGRPTDATFRVVLPASGARTLVQFQVSGEGPNGLLTRGAAFNVLPDGPTEILTAVTTASGERLLNAPARRIDR